jgi:hypothetical protein
MTDITKPSPRVRIRPAQPATIKLALVPGAYPVTRRNPVTTNSIVLGYVGRVGKTYRGFIASARNPKHLISAKDFQDSYAAFCYITEAHPVKSSR